MAISGGPDIVEDGLVLYLDTADPNSLPPGQSIKDLVTGTAFSGGSYSSADWANNIIEITICLWWKKVGNATSYATNPINKFNGSTSRASFVLYHFHNYNSTAPNSEGVMRWYANKAGAWGSISSSYTATLNETAFTVLQYNASTGGQMWKNNNKIGPRSPGGNLGTTGSGYGGIGFTGLTESNSTTNVFSASLYDRELTDDEILQNYNATKGRYGL